MKKLGQEYVLNLSGDVGNEFEERMANGKTDFDDIYEIADRILPHLFDNGDDLSGVDLLLEIE